MRYLVSSFMNELHPKVRIVFQLALILLAVTLVYKTGMLFVKPAVTKHLAEPIFNFIY